MCIAIASPAGNKLPCYDYLQMSFTNNPDGAGFAFSYNDKVHIVKGLMTFEKFIEALKKHDELYDLTKNGCLIHFRIQTTGGVFPECTHPFPISTDHNELHSLEGEYPYAIVHNGVIDLTKSSASATDKMSDTMVFIEQFLTKIASNQDWFKNDVNMELIYNMIKSKMAILNSDGDVALTQGFILETDGNYYSNNTYKELRPKKSATGSYANNNTVANVAPIIKLESLKDKENGMSPLMYIKSKCFIDDEGFMNKSSAYCFWGKDRHIYIAPHNTYKYLTGDIPSIVSDLLDVGVGYPIDLNSNIVEFNQTHKIDNSHLCLTSKTEEST